MKFYLSTILFASLFNLRYPNRRVTDEQRGKVVQECLYSIGAEESKDRISIFMVNSM